MFVLVHCAVQRNQAAEKEQGQSREQSQEFSYYHENVLGTSLGIRLNAASESSAKQAESRILAEIERLSKIYSSYDSQSELHRLLAAPVGRPFRASVELQSIIQESNKWNARTGGAFDMRVEPLSSLWKTAAAKNRMPAPEAIEAVLKQIQSTHFDVDSTAGTITRQGIASVTFNAIATGSIIDRACQKAMEESSEITGVMLDIGGDIKIAGDMTADIGVAHPAQKAENTRPIAWLRLTNKAVTTSGDLYRGFEIDGHHYSHILDPRTGRPVQNVVSATVIAPTAEMADVLATAFNVMDVEASLTLAESLDGVACLLVSQNGTVVASQTWSQYVVPVGGLRSVINSSLTSLFIPEPLIAQAKKPALLPLEVQFEIEQTGDTRRYRRPYVAVWVEDQDGISIRTISLWLQKGHGERWHPDLRRWYRDDQTRRLLDERNLIETVSKPTRPPGKYSVVWDGLDDDGEPVKPGKYTILIEAAREHGTYQLIRQELDLSDKPIDKKLAGNVEVKSARLIYGNNAGK